MLLACAPEVADSADSAAPVAPCGAWAGVARVGTRWSYIPTDTYVQHWGFDGTSSIEVTVLDGEDVTLVETGDYAGEEGSFSWRRTESWRCDAQGAWWIGSAGVTEVESGTTSVSQEGWRTFDPGWRIRPSELEDWSDRFTVTTANNGADPVSVEVACETTLSPTETRTVGEEDVAAVQVIPICDELEGETAWLGEGVGLLANDDVELVDFEP